jgi:hypothetical protein
MLKSLGSHHQVAMTALLAHLHTFSLFAWLGAVLLEWRYRLGPRRTTSPRGAARVLIPFRRASLALLAVCGARVALSAGLQEGELSRLASLAIANVVALALLVTLGSGPLASWSWGSTTPRRCLQSLLPVTVVSLGYALLQLVARDVERWS